MFGSFFDTVAVDEYADTIIAELKRTLPAGFDAAVKDVSQRVNKIDGVLTRLTTDLARKTKLNIYKKARLTARVKEGMSAHGYPKPFVDAFAMDLIRRVGVAANQAKA